MENINIRPNLLKIISKIAETKQIGENEVVNDLILRGIIELEDEIFEDEIDIEIVAAEFGQTKEELIKELDEARAEIAAGKSIIVEDVNELRERYNL